MHNIKMLLFFSMLLLCSFFRLKKLFQVENGLTTSLLFFLKMAKIWVGQTTLNGGEKKRMALNFYRQCDSHEEALLLALFILTKYRQKGHMTNHFPAAVTFSESQDFLLQILKNEDLKNIERSQQRQKKG